MGEAWSRSEYCLDCFSSLVIQLFVCFLFVCLFFSSFLFIYISPVFHHAITALVDWAQNNNLLTYLLSSFYLRQIIMANAVTRLARKQNRSPCLSSVATNAGSCVEKSQKYTHVCSKTQGLTVTICFIHPSGILKLSFDLIH